MKARDSRRAGRIARTLSRLWSERLLGPLPEGWRNVVSLVARRDARTPCGQLAMSASGALSLSITTRCPVAMPHNARIVADLAVNLADTVTGPRRQRKAASR